MLRVGMCLAVTKSRDYISNLKTGIGGNPKMKGITNTCLRGEQVREWYIKEWQIPTP